MSGYTRNDTNNNIATGNVVRAADLDGEFDAVEAAFNGSTGHTHDGTTGEGGPITKIGPAQNVTVTSQAVLPSITDTMDLGTDALRYKTGYFERTVVARGGFVGNVTGDITGDVVGNASTASTLETPRTISLAGDVTGSAAFDGAANITITANVVDDSHNHIISDVDGLTSELQSLNSGLGAVSTALTTKAELDSPSFTGTPTVPTPTAGDNSTKIASTAYVSSAIASLIDSAPDALNTLNEISAALNDDPDFAATVLTTKADVNSPNFTGTPTAPTPATSDSTTKLATTAYVKNNTASLTPNTRQVIAGTGLTGGGALTGDVTLNVVGNNGIYSSNNEIGLESSGVSAGTYGSSTQIPSLTVDSRGRVTSASNNTLSVPQIGILAGSVAHGGTIPVPPGFTRAQCKYIVSPRTWNTDAPSGKSLDALQLTCTVNQSTGYVTITMYSNQGPITTTGTANYLVIATA